MKETERELPLLGLDLGYMRFPGTAGVLCCCSNRMSCNSEESASGTGTRAAPPYSEQGLCNTAAWMTQDWPLHLGLYFAQGGRMRPL